MKKCCEMKGFLSFVVLRMISQKNMSGEQVSQEIKRRKGTKPSPGTIYPALKALSENGLIKEIEKSTKEKKYEITPKGEKELSIATKKFCQMFYDMKEELIKSHQ